ncbi:exodeoxyribonuclease VII large subunit [Sulfuriferula nivalis]|uniref:Exodeoxyribonuclease 7 large subunit n=1 Tax=Sulfuriferula nivalis TaxID=2675298 RepID=A0A809S8C0_9PROT|nr:exodeoxyribonuclease VII large subunit [Sulfuriferula nivalis]BBP00122.1 exodeoxyribonuclease 7 large subunit [Sulfuriferula nivalis]
MTNSPLNQPASILTVTSFNRWIQQTLISTIPLTWVAGEISNLTRAASGHWYFSLKDAQAQVRCVMFRGRNQFIDWQPENGMQVEVRATAGLYEPRGEFQLQVENLRRAGLGALFEAFERLKRKLELEGLFDSARKRAIPAMPRQIGIITSPQAAALRDVLTTLNRLMPSLPVILYPCQVQGTTAPAQIINALNFAYQRAECDVLIICRGGGSIEDLWAFNDEQVARTVTASPIPIISGVGHETDFTITDFVSDLRAPTPTAAASLACPNRDQLLQSLDLIQARLSRQLRSQIAQRQQKLQHLTARLVHPGKRIQTQRITLQQFANRLRLAQQANLQQRIWQQAQLKVRLKRPNMETRRSQLTQYRNRMQLTMQHLLSQRLSTLQHLRNELNHLSPNAVLTRGYAIVSDEQGDIVHNTAQLDINAKLSIHFAKDSVDTQVRRLYTTNRLKK